GRGAGIGSLAAAIAAEGALADSLITRCGHYIAAGRALFFQNAVSYLNEAALLRGGPMKQIATRFAISLVACSVLFLGLAVWAQGPATGQGKNKEGGPQRIYNTVKQK